MRSGICIFIQVSNLVVLAPEIPCRAILLLEHIKRQAHFLAMKLILGIAFGERWMKTLGPFWKEGS